MIKPRSHPEPADVAWEMLAPATTDVAREAPIRIVQRVLRGRSRIVAVVGLALGTLAAIGGYHAKPLIYRSQGLVRIDAALSPILYNTEESRIPPMFEAFVSAQEAYLQSRDVLDEAIAAPMMREAGWPEGDQGVAILQRKLEVKRGRREQLITVAVTDQDPHRAKAGVNAVLAAFETSVVDPSRATASLKEQTLVDRERDLQRRVRLLREEVLEISHQFGTEAVSRMHTARVQEMLELERKIAALDPNRGATPMPATAGVSKQLAQLDAKEISLIAEIASLRGRYGSSHPIMRGLERQLSAVRMQKDLILRPADVTAGGETRRQHIARHAMLQTEIEGLGRQLVEIAEVEARIRETDDLLRGTRRRLDEIRVESSREDMNRITIAARGDLPLAPISDRRAVLTAAGFAFGCFAGGGLVFLFGILNPRARYLDELELLEDDAPVLGAVPDISHATPDAAAPSVHQLRNLLELQASDPRRNVFAVTSADRGEGRTSLALALATSFAAAGRRALVIDADLGRAGLSRVLDIEAKDGLRQALSTPAASPVYNTGHEGLWAMPAGRGLDPADLTVGTIRNVLDALRGEYDAIVVDTGPVLASIEACVVNAACDSVVMAVARGRRLTRVRAALDRLRQAGVACAGSVLNRAQLDDRPDREIQTSGVATLVAGPAPAAPAASVDLDAPDTIPFTRPAANNGGAGRGRKKAA